MINFEKTNLIPVSKEDVEAGSRAIMINDTVFVLGGGSNIDFSATTATSEDVKEGKQFYNADGVLTQGTLVQGVGGEFYKCVEIGTGETSTDLIISGAGAEAVNGTYTLVDSSATGIDRVWKHESAEYYIVYGKIYVWSIYDEVEDVVLYQAENQTEDLFAVTWVVNEGWGIANAPTVTHTSNLPANTWSGYKAVLIKNSIIVSGAGYEEANGTYTNSILTDVAKDKRYIKKISDTLHYRLSCQASDSQWMLYKVVKKNETSTEYTPLYLSSIPESDNNEAVEASLFGEYEVSVFGTSPAPAVTPSDTEEYYDFEETLTTGLTYGNGFTPEVNGVYDAEALIKAELWTVGAAKWVFAEKFDGSLTHIYTQLGEDPVFETIDGRSCMKVDTSHTFSYPSDALPSGNAPRTICAWIYTNNDNNYSHFAGYGKTENYPSLSPASSIALYYTNAQGYPGGGQYEISTSAWVHVAIAFDGTTIKLYINGTLQKSGSYAVDTVIGNDYPLAIGYCPFNTNNSTNGYISDLQIYDYELSAEEIQQLYQEFSA